MKNQKAEIKRERTKRSIVLEFILFSLFLTLIFNTLIQIKVNYVPLYIIDPISLIQYLLGIKINI